MASQALYRKWRSQTFSDLIGQEPVVRTLKNGLLSGRIAHAYLLCGPRGTGKTSTARLLAKTVNCQNPQQGEPCNLCLNCREITEGRSLDVIEIDAASNRGIDEIRNLREKVGFSPGSGRYKVYVLDEAHMLTTEACNALLKTLEEPPEHVIFVLATTEAHRLPATVVSRCQRFDFKRFSVREIAARLRFVAGQEGWSLEPGAVELLARAAAGGMRDALSLLDRAVAMMGATVTAEGTQQMLGLADTRLVRELVEHIAYLRGAEGLHLINRLAEAGADLRQLSAQVADYWRALLLARAGADVEVVLEYTPEDAAEILQVSGLFALDELSAFARLFSQNDVGARSVSLPQLAVELAFVDCLHLHRQRANGTAAPPTSLTGQQAPAQTSVPRPSQPPGIRQTPGDAPRGAATLSPTGPVTTPSAGRAGVDEILGSKRVVSPAEAAWSFEEAPEPLIPELRPRSAPSQEASAALFRAPVSVGQPAQMAAPEPPSFSPAPLPAPRAAGPASSQADVSFAEKNNWYEAREEESAGEAGEAGAVLAAPLLNLSDVTRQWELVKKACKTRSPKLAALLNNAAPVSIQAGTPPEVVIRVEFDFHFKQLIEPASREMVVWALGQILEMPCRTHFLQKDEPIPAAPAGASVAPVLPQRRQPAISAMAALPEVGLASLPPGDPASAHPLAPEPPSSAQTSASTRNPLQATNGQSQPQPTNGQRPTTVPSPDALKEMVLHDPVVEEVIRTYGASLVEWKRLEE